MRFSIKFQIIFFILSGYFFISQVYAATVTVVTDDYPPYNYRENGKIVGASTEVVQEVLKRAKIKFFLKTNTFKQKRLKKGINLFSWEKAYNQALEKANVLIYSIARTPKREEFFKWVDVIAPFDVYFYKLKERKDIKVKELYQAREYTVGGVRSTARAEYLIENGFVSAKNLEIVSNESQNLKNLLNKKIDMLPIDEIGFYYLLKEEKMTKDKFEKVMPLKDLSMGLYMAFSNKTNDSIINDCKKALKSMKQDGTYDKIISKYLK